MDDLKYKTGLQRLGAALLDGLIFVPFILIEEWLFANTADINIKMTWTISFIALSLFYTIFLHYKYGQTLGKYITRVKVMDVSETRLLSLKQSVMRDSVYILIEVSALLYFLYLVNAAVQKEEPFEAYRNFTAYPGLVWVLLELISMLANKKRRAVHDFLANSVVVKV